MFSDNLDRIMKEKHILQKKLSKLADLNLSTISSLLRRESRNPDLETIRSIAKVLVVTESYLVFGTEIFDMQHFDQILASKNIDIKELVLETGCDATYLINSKMPPLNDQDRIADYLVLKRNEVFFASYSQSDYFRAFRINKKIINSNDIVIKEQFNIMFDKLNDENRKIVYNLACDLLKTQMNKYLRKYNK